MNNFSKILIITILLNINAFSQKLIEMHVVGNAEFLSSELIDKNIKDANGETCAGLIIQSDLTGLNYTSYNGIVKINKKPGQDLLFLSQDERVVTIFAEGFSPLKIILNDYGIKLESGKVWQIKITGEKKNTSGLIPVTFSINSKDANIILDNMDKGKERTLQLSRGKHNISVSLSGYKTINKEIEVSENKVYFDFALEEVDLVKLTVRSNPEGAKIYLNDAEKGETNKDLWVYPGMQRIKLSMEGYADIQADIDVKDGVKNDIKYDMEKNIGELYLTVLPSDAEVLINNVNYTGKNTIVLIPGKYQIAITKPNYFAINENVDIELGKRTEKIYNLIKSTGELQLTVEPSDAEVLINNVNYTGIHLIEFSPGKYQIAVSKPNYFTINENVDIELGKRIGKTYNLLKSTGELHLTVLPVDAEVLINNVNYTGKNAIELIPGKYKIKITEPNYFTINENVDIELGKRIEKTYNLLKSTGELHLTVLPADAEVLINKENYTGKNIIELPPGKNKIEITKENYYSISDIIDSESGKVLDKGYSLTPLTGKLQISIQPIDANVTIKKNGEVVKQFVGSEIVKNLQIGNYTIEAKMPGYKTLKKEIMILENQTTTTELEMVKGEDNSFVYGEKTYKTMTIGDQTWMAENLNVDHFRNGDIIPEAKTNEEWKAAGENSKPAWCYYDNDSENGVKYGKLYNWYAINDPRGLVPDGWHIPTKEEFELLKKAVGNNSNTLKSVGEGVGTNTSGFSALMCGFRNDYGEFDAFYFVADFWSSKGTNMNAYNMCLYKKHSAIELYLDAKGNGCSVRAVKDANEKIAEINQIKTTSKNNNTIVYKDKIYKTIKIGNQTWLAENLKVDHFRNGDVIPEARTKEEWIAAGENEKPAWCYYNNDSENGVKYGKLYNWYAVNDPRVLAPAGWHIPSKVEFELLKKAVGSNSNALKSIGEGTGNGIGTNTSNFSAQMCGYRKNYTGDFSSSSTLYSCWSSTDNNTNAYNMYLSTDDSIIYLYDNHKVYGFSVRAVKDANEKIVEINQGEITSENNNTIVYKDKIYKTIKIGNQTWLAENLKVDHFRNGDVIPEARTKEEWIAAGENEKPAWCYYNNDSENGVKYGKLYNWFAVNDPRGLSPEGWHIPTKTEFNTLEEVVDNNGNSLKTIQEGTGKGTGTNISGFSVLMCGYRNYTGDFDILGGFADFWTSTKFSDTNVYSMYLSNYGSNIYLSTFNKLYGFSVRAVKD